MVRQAPCLPQRQALATFSCSLALPAAHLRAFVEVLAPSLHKLHCFFSLQTQSVQEGFHFIAVDQATSSLSLSERRNHDGTTKSRN